MSKHATVSQIVAAMTLLREHVIPVEDGVEYAPGWTDERVAVEVGAPVGSITRLRRKEFGAFAVLKRRTASRRYGYSPKNTEIMRKLDEAIETMAEINTKLDKLVNSLS